MTTTPDWVKILRCPIDGQPLVLSEDGAWLVNEVGQHRYPIDGGIAMLLAEHAQPLQAVENQQNHD